MEIKDQKMPKQNNNHKLLFPRHILGAGVTLQIQTIRCLTDTQSVRFTPIFEKEI